MSWQQNQLIWRYVCSRFDSVLFSSSYQIWSPIYCTHQSACMKTFSQNFESQLCIGSVIFKLFHQGKGIFQCFLIYLCELKFLAKKFSFIQLLNLCIWHNLLFSLSTVNLKKWLHNVSLYSYLKRQKVQTIFFSKWGGRRCGQR